MSLQEVRHKLTRVADATMNERSTVGDRRWFEVCKYDFCVFFMNVCRRQVGRALDDWANEGAQIWHQGGAIRMVRQNKVVAWREVRTLDLL